MAAAALPLSNEHLAIVLQRVAEGITVQAPDGRLLYANDAAAQLIGFASAADLLATPVREIMARFEVLDADGQPLPLDRLPGRRALLGEESFARLRFHVRDSDQERWSMVRATPVRDDTGQVRFAINTFHDITEQEHIQERLRRQGARAHALAAVSQALAAAGPGLQAVLDTVVREAAQAIGEGSMLQWLSADKRYIEPLAIYHADPEALAFVRSLLAAAPRPADDLLQGPLFRDGQPVRLSGLPLDQMREMVRPEYRSYVDRFGLHSVLAVPVRVEDRTAGVLSVWRGKAGLPYTEEDELFLADLAGRAALAIERARLHEALATERERLLLAQEAGRIGTFDWHIPSDAVVWTPELEAVYGLPPGSFGGHYDDWRQRVHPDDLPPVEVEIQRALASGEDLHAEFRAVWPDGGVRHVAVLARVLRGSDGQPERLVGVNMDVTARNQALAEARAAAERTARLQAVTAALSEAATPSAVAAVVVEQGVRALGAQAGLLALLAEDGTPDLLGSAGYPDSLVADWHAGRLATPALVQEVARVGEAVWVESSAAMLARYPGYGGLQARLPFEARGAVPLHARGRIIGVLGFSYEAPRAFSDDERAFAATLAELAAQALERSRLYAEAQEAVRARDQFLSIASHELKTPVAGIKAIAQVLQRLHHRGALTDDRLLDYLHRVEEASDRLNALTTDLLDVARLQLGRFPLHPEPLDLAALVATVVEDYRSRLDPAHTLETRLPSEPLWIRADRLRLGQVLGNLLDNAAKYSPRGGVIRLALEPSGDGVLLRVSDEGIGLPLGVQEAIFEPFGRAANAQERHLPGMGLGLYVCRQIVDLHGGRIQAESAGEGQGSTFHVWLPAGGPPEDEPLDPS